MKKNIGKKACGFVLSTLAIVMPFITSIENVSAAETHTNFYFFSDAFTVYSSSNQESIINRINEATNTTNDYVYDIPSNAEIVNQGWVDLSESGGDSSGQSTSNWDVRMFWSMYQASYRRLVGSGEGIYTPDENGLYHYQLHGGWSSGGVDFDVEDKLNVSTSSLNDLVNASVIPEVASSTTVDINRQGRMISVTIQRTVSNSSPNIEAWQTPIRLSNDGTTANWVLVPALYYLTYTIPDEEVPMFAITQYYYDNGSGDEIQPSKVMGTNYENGKTYNIACPASIGNYRLVSKANTSVTINNADGKSECYYEQVSNPSEPSQPIDQDIQENPTTSDIPIYIVWAIGAGALGYSVYYFNKYYRKNKEM